MLTQFPFSLSLLRYSLPGEQSNVAYIPHVIGFLTGVPFGAAWSKNLAKNLLITLGLFLIYLAIIIFLISLITQT